MLTVSVVAIRVVVATASWVVMSDDLSLPGGVVIPEDEEALCCESPHLSVQEVSGNRGIPPILGLEKAAQMAELFGLLADPNRLRLLSILVAQEQCVGDLAVMLGMNESAVSHQLRTLRALRLVNARKQGRHVFYRLHDNHVLSLYQAVLEHLDE
jgi:ArsR family transcriptional regulator, lead/cadmium/zinc/bismuth-responsive transcriptional repressor